MTRNAPPEHAARTRALKLLQLARRGVGGERTNASRLLLTHLQTHDLTLYDIDPGLPVTQDLAALDTLREAQLQLARLGTDGQDEALGFLVDDPTLTPAEIDRVLGVMDLEILARTRAEVWAHLDGLEDHAYQGVTHRVTPQVLHTFTGSIAERAQAALRQAHWEVTYPLRTLRVQGELDQAVVAGLLSGLGAVRVQVTAEGVQAHLSGDQLARARSMMVQDLPDLRAQAVRAARNLAHRHAEARRG